MPKYEHVFLARQDLAQNQVDALAEEVTKLVEGAGGKVAKTETWGLRTIAYRIAKNRKAHYVLIEFEAPGELVAEIERQWSINEDVIRYLTVRVDTFENGPSAVMRKGERDRDRRSDRGDRGERSERSDRPARGPRPERDAA